MKADSNEYVLSKLNSFHKNIQLTIKVQRECRISILDVLMIRDKSNIKTRVHCKSTNNNIYINWKTYAPNKKTIGNLKTLENKLNKLSMSKTNTTSGQ